jgi:hypothetical protein
MEVSRQSHFESLGETRMKTPKKTEGYPLRYVEDFFGVSNEVAAKLSNGATGNPFSPPC